MSDIVERLREILFLSHKPDPDENTCKWCAAKKDVADAIDVIERERAAGKGLLDGQAETIRTLFGEIERLQTDRRSRGGLNDHNRGSE